MLKVGDKVIHYLDDIEGYRVFEIIHIGEYNCCLLQGIDTNTTINRVLSNDKPSKVFNYYKLEG